MTGTCDQSLSIASFINRMHTVHMKNGAMPVAILRTYSTFWMADSIYQICMA